jgi:hypothetical protein
VSEQTFQIAFNDGPLAAAPVYTNVGDTTGIKVQGYTVDRGRATERDKVGVGTATVWGLDLSGALDPTNATSPFYAAGATKIDPCHPARVNIFNPVDSTYHPIFTGHVSRLVYRIAPSGEFAYWTFELVDDLDIVSDAEMIPGKAGTAAPEGSEGNCFYAAQQVNDRILALLADAALSVGVVEWPAAKFTVFSGNVAVQKKVYSARTTILTGIDDACDAEIPGVATRYCDRFGVFTFHGRYARFNPADVSYGINRWKVGDVAAFTADPTYVAMSTEFEFDRGKDNLINAALATTQGMSRTIVASQIVVDQPSINKYGARSIGFEDLIVDHGDESAPGPNLAGPDEVKQYGNHWVTNYKTPQNRPGTITFTTEDPGGAHANAWTLMSGVELNDIFQLKTTHNGGGGFADVDHFVEHLHYEGKPGGGKHDVTLTVEVSPRAHYTTNIFAT